MIRVVIDTNVVVSANLIDEGLPASILDLAANKKILMVVSVPVLAEYEKVLSRPRLKLDPIKVKNSLTVKRNTKAEDCSTAPIASSRKIEGEKPALTNPDR